MKSFKFMIALLMLASFTLFAQSASINTMVEKAQTDMGKSMVYTNGDFAQGVLKKGEAYYATLTFYKSNKYSIAIGGTDNVKKLKLYLYEENMLKPIAKETLGPNQIKIIHVDAKTTGNYYLKIFLEDGTDVSDWFFLYGFKE